MPSDWQRSLALRLLKAGATCTAAAEEACLCVSTVSAIAKSAGIVRKGGFPKGKVFPDARKPPEIRQKALQLVKDGATLRAAGAAVGVSHESVNQWAKEAGLRNLCTRRITPSMEKWRLEHPHDTPPFRLTPSPNFGYSSMSSN
jgi:hypothetical protein